MKPETVAIVKDLALIFFGEFFGTGILVFVGCMGLNQDLDQLTEQMGCSLSFGMAVFLGVQISGHISGGHINPAITVLSVFFKKIKLYAIPVYIFAQVTGGLTGFGFLISVTPGNLVNSTNFEDFGMCTSMPHPKVALVQALGAEFVFSLIFMFFVCSLWDTRNMNHDSATLKFGFAVFVLSFVGVPYSGCSMNPAKAFAPAVWNNSWTNHWIYWLAPIAAAIISGLFYTKCLNPPNSNELPEGTINR